MTHGNNNTHDTSEHLPESASSGQTQHPKVCFVVLDNWPIKVQLGSTNSKGLPMLFQGSHQVFFLNNDYLPALHGPYRTSFPC